MNFRDRIYWTGRVFPVCMKYGVFLFVLLMMAGRFGTFREIGFYLPASLWLVGSLLNRRVGFNWREPLFIVLCLLSASALSTALMTASFFSGLHLFKREYLKLLLLYAVIATTFRNREDLDSLARFMAFTGVIYLFSGFWKIFSSLIEAGSIDYEATRNYASLFLYFLPFIILEAAAGNRTKRVLWMLPLAGLVFGIFLTGVRGSWLGLAVVLLIWWTSFLKFRARQITELLKRGIPVLALLMVAVFLIFPSEFNLLKDRFGARAPVSDRFEAWRHYIELSRENPIMGHGLDYDAMIGHYRETYKTLTGTYPAAGKPLTPHNQYITILYRQGIVGLLLYVLLFVMLLYRTARAAFSLGRVDLSFIGIAIVTAVTGEYVVRCLTEDRSLVPLGVLIGLAGAFLDLTASAKYPESAAKDVF